MNIIEKEKFLEEQGWVREGSDCWVKSEWLRESKRFNLEPHLCPHWYHYEKFDEAYIIAVRELAEKLTKENYAIETAIKLERILHEAMTSGNEGIKVFTKKHIYQWYLVECKGKPNPFIIKEFEKK